MQKPGSKILVLSVMVVFINCMFIFTQTLIPNENLPPNVDFNMSMNLEMLTKKTQRIKLNLA